LGLLEERLDEAARTGIFREIAQLRREVAELRGNGRVVRPTGDIEMRNQKIRGVSRSHDEHGVCPRKEIRANTPYNDGVNHAATMPLNMALMKIINLLDPTDPQDAATKAYVDAQVLAVEGGAAGGAMTFQDFTPNLTETGTAWVLAATPTSPDNVSIFLNGLKIDRVAATPNANQYTLSGTTLTTGRTLVAGESLEGFFRVSTTTAVFDDLTPLLTETGTSWTLSQTPVDATQISLFLNGANLRQVTSGPTSNQYTISGVNITTGRSLTAGETLDAIYRLSVTVGSFWDDLTPTLTETGTSFTLTKTPVAPNQTALFLNGMKLRRVTSGPSSSEYTVSGTSVVTGRSLTTGEFLEAIYNA